MENTSENQAQTALARGAAGGVAGTVVFTAFMWGAQRLGLLGEMPPTTLTRRTVEALTGVRPPRPALRVLTTIGHFAYGAGTGALFGFAVRSLAARGSSRAHTATLAGAGFGALVYAVSYMGWVPAVGLMPPPHRDRPARPLVTFLGHLLFGGVLGAIARVRR